MQDAGGPARILPARPANAPRVAALARRVGALVAAVSMVAMAAGAMVASPAAAQDARYLGSVAGSPLDRPIVGMAATPTGRGYWLVASDGGIFAFGDARFHGTTGGTTLNRPIVGMAATPTGRGYWLVASDGGIFTFGDARFHGSTGGTTLNRPIVAMASTRSGDGYWLVASDGGIFAFGDARFHGCTGGTTLNRPIVAMASTRSGNGYWLVASDGGIFTFGDARFHGSTGALSLVSPIVAMASTRTGSGYWMIASDGGIFAFGDARFHGSAAGRPAMGTIASMAASPRDGYWMVTTDGAVLTATRSSGFKIDPNLAALSPDLAIARDLYYRINDERTARGLRALAWDPVLADLAAGWARQMAAAGSMYHQNLQGLFGTPVVASRFIALRENIYTGNGIYRDAGSSHVAFMRSDPHRADILVPELTVGRRGRGVRQRHALGHPGLRCPRREPRPRPRTHATSGSDRARRRERALLLTAPGTPADAVGLALTDVSLTMNATVVLDSVTWRVASRERWVVLGPNGAGKTSLLRIAALALHPSRGTVEVVGETLGRCDVRSVRERIGFAGATVAASLEQRMTAVEVVMTGLHAALAPWWHTYTEDDRMRATSLLARFGCAPLAEHGFATLSSGERQRVLLARTLVRDPELVLLDEPTAGLDVGGREQLVADLTLVASDDLAPPVVLVTHHLEEIPPGFTHALALRGGRVVASGAIGDVVTDRVLSETFGLPLRAELSGGRWSARPG